MRFSRAAIALYVGLIFASGVVLGVFAQRLYSAQQDAHRPGPRNPEALRKKVVDTFHDRLHLTDAQVQQLNAIMDETRARVDEVRHQNRSLFQKIHEEQDAKFRAILTPEQQVEFDKLQKEREERMREERQRQNGRGISVNH